MGANPFALHFTGEFLMRLKHRAGGDMEEWPADLRVCETPTTSQED